MPIKPLHLKMGAKAGTRAFLRRAPAFLKTALRPAGLRIAPRLVGKFDFLVAFVTDVEDLPATFRSLKPRIQPGGQLWVAWPKRGNDDSAGPRLADVIRIGYDHGLVESQCISLHEDWSALKFTFPKPGKTYHNSYGKLPES